MPTPTWIYFATPIVGALSAYFLNRGSRLRRARTAALEDLDMHERARRIFEGETHLIDQLRAQARESVRIYASRRAAQELRVASSISLASMVMIAVTLGWFAVARDVNSWWALTALGGLGGVVGIVVEGVARRTQTWLALHNLPTRDRSA